MPLNSHDAPYVRPFASTPMVDRDQRAGLAAVIRRFLDEQDTAFEFAKQLDEYRSSTDSAVQIVTKIASIWYDLDCCDDQIFALSKPEWDYFQRLLLLLESDSIVETRRSRRWSWSQAVAAIALLGFVFFAWNFGWGKQLFIVAIPFGIVSIGISKLRAEVTNSDPFGPLTFPFDSFTDLKNAYESAKFKKKQFPRKIAARRIRSPFMDWFYRMLFYVHWVIWSPIPLLFQTFPTTVVSTHVITSNQ